MYIREFGDSYINDITYWAQYSGLSSGTAVDHMVSALDKFGFSTGTPQDRLREFANAFGEGDGNWKDKLRGFFRIPRRLYRVATDGSGDFTTIAQVNAATFNPGDVIAFRRGDTFNDAKLTFPSSGSSSAAITLTNYGSGAKPIFNYTTTTDNMYFLSKSYVTVDGLQFTDGADTGCNIYMRNSSYITIKNCDFSVTGGTNVHWAICATQYSGNTTAISNIVVDSCTFTGVGDVDTVRFTQGSSSGNGYFHSCSVTNCTFTNSPQNAIRIFLTKTEADAGYLPYNFNISNNTIKTTGFSALCLQGGSNITVRNNVCTEIGNAGTANVNAFQFNKISNSLIENNTITNVYTSAPDGCGIILDYAYTDDDHISNNNIVRNNRISGCNESYSAGILNFRGENNQIYNNIINDCYIGIAISGSVSTGVTIYHNDIHDVTKYCVWLEGATPSGTLVKNNILSTAERGIYVQDTATVPTEDYNSFYGMTVSNFYDNVHTTEVTLGTHSISADPKLNADYTLKSDSPCINAGTDVGVTTDYAGRTRSGTPDIGAYEYAG